MSPAQIELTTTDLDNLRRTVRRCERLRNKRAMPVDLVGGPLDGMRTTVDRHLGQGAFVGWSIKVGDRQMLTVILYRWVGDEWIFDGIEHPGWPH